MKKQTVVALVLLLLIPMVTILGRQLFSLINPEIAAGHSNYVLYFQILSRVKMMMVLGSMVAVGILWVVACFLVIASKERSAWWLFLAVLGPFGFAILATLNDRAPAESDRYARFVRSLNSFVRPGYEVCLFVLIWTLAEQAMVFKRNLMIMRESAATGMSVAQIIDLQNASSGMWAFAEGMEVMYMVVLLYLIWPMTFNIVSRAASLVASPKAG